MRGWLLLAGLSLVLAGFGGPAQSQDAEALLEAKCVECHERTADGELSRVAQQRKTPEGWDMTLVRKIQFQGVELTPEERSTLVKHLADTKGLAPAETAEFRYILERMPAVFEEPPSPELGEMCARCHSWARTGLQRRTVDEWRHLAHFHLGQYPTTEYQALGRDRAWWEIASEEAPFVLAATFPFDTPAWREWQDREAPDLAGEWRLVGRDPARGHYHGVASVSEAEGDDRYDVRIELTYEDGTEMSGEGSGVLYTGHEWRSRIMLGDTETLQVFGLSEDGSTLSGRSFLAEADSIGSRVTNVRMDEGTQAVLAVVPPHLRAGEEAEVAIHGIGLDGEVSLGEGVEIEEVVSQDAQTMVVRVRAAEDAANGRRTVTVGELSAGALFTVYQAIDFVTVEPGYNIARVGGAGGPIPKVPAQFEAIAWLFGDDGQPGTEDDVEIGPVPARWSVDNFDEIAEAMQDARFAGTMQPDGIFMPADAGPNPERPFQTNNAGNLRVIATVEDDGQIVEGLGQLLVTVQRWNDPPIR